jgi:Trk-type K+ transport system membrane component
MILSITQIVLIVSVILIAGGITYGIFMEVLEKSGKKEVLIRSNKTSKRKRD